MVGRFQRQRQSVKGGAALVPWIAWALLGAAPEAAAEPALDAGVPFEVVVVDMKSASSGIVSGTLVNRTDQAVRDVKLLIRHEWLWNEEMNPGPDFLNPGRAVFHTVEGEVAPQGRREFVYRPDPPLRTSPSGSFRTKVEVVGFTEIGN